jgi:uncharacterized protein with gpF-like domain
LKGDFYAKGNEFENGDPPLHPNCRCVLLPVLDKEKAFDTETFTKITELEKLVDKRTKEFKLLQTKDLERDEYVKELEKILGIDDE